MLRRLRDRLEEVSLPLVDEDESESYWNEGLGDRPLITEVESRGFICRLLGSCSLGKEILGRGCGS